MPSHPTLDRCCPPGYRLIDYTFGVPTCYYRERDFHERVLTGLTRWVDPSKPPVAMDCNRTASAPTPTTRSTMPRLGGLSLRRTTGFRGDPLPFIQGGSEPPPGASIPGNIGDIEIPGIGVTISEGAGIVGDVIDFLGGGGGNGATQETLVAQTGTAGQCPGLFSVRVGDRCVDLSALPPGGDPAVMGPVRGTNGFQGFGPAVKGIYGVGIQPRQEAQTVNRCPPGFALGKDGVCYEGLARNSPRRKWPMGMKPLLTAGDRAAIRKAKSAAKKLAGSKKSLKKAARALEKVC